MSIRMVLQVSVLQIFNSGRGNLVLQQQNLDALVYLLIKPTSPIKWTWHYVLLEVIYSGRHNIISVSLFSQSIARKVMSRQCTSSSSKIFYKISIWYTLKASKSLKRRDSEFAKSLRLKWHDKLIQHGILNWILKQK